MNVIFLDVDGVLNSINHLKEEYYKNKRPYSGYDYPFDRRCLLNLLYLVNITDSYIVITSTWRKDKIGRNILLNELAKYDLDKRVIGYTDILYKRRGEEVKDFLLKNSNITNFIIIDDDSDFEGLEDYLIKTNYQNGLTNDDVGKAIKKLIKK